MGCSKVSSGCVNCYMFRDAERYGRDPNQVQRVSDKTFYQALKWKDPRMIFCNSWSDYFHSEADEWRDDAWGVIKQTQQHHWQVLTKRIERVKYHLPLDWDNGYPNVWLGVSVENQFCLDRVEELARIPAWTRFISFEPLLGSIDLSSLADQGVMSQIHWAIVGAESGNETGKYLYRPCEIQWMEDLVDQLQKLGIKVFVKQLGTYQAKKLGLRDRMGATLEQWPSSLNHLKIQEFPV